jgi:hypothetical protein
MRNAVIGLVIACALALALSPVRIAGIDAWKIVLGVVGAFLVVTAGRNEKAR